MPVTDGCKPQSITGRALPSSAMWSPGDVTMRYGAAATVTRVPCAVSGIVCSMPCVPRSSGRQRMTQIARPHRSPRACSLIPWFDRKRPFLRPDLPIGKASSTALLSHKKGLLCPLTKGRRSYGLRALKAGMVPNRNGTVTSAVLVHLRVEPAHFDSRWRERPALALLAWEALARDPLGRLRRIQVESTCTA